MAEPVAGAYAKIQNLDAHQELNGRICIVLFSAAHLDYVEVLLGEGISGHGRYRIPKENLIRVERVERKVVWEERPW